MRIYQKNALQSIKKMKKKQLNKEQLQNLQSWNKDM